MIHKEIFIHHLGLEVPNFIHSKDGNGLNEFKIWVK